MSWERRASGIQGQRQKMVNHPNRGLDRRIEAIDIDDGQKIVLLRPGYAYQDANSPNACHTFGEDTMAEVRQTMKLIKKCACPDCKKALAGSGKLWS